MFPVMSENGSGINAVDAFALSMFGVIGLAMGTLLLLFLCMRREVARRDAQVDALLEEVEREERDNGRAVSGERGSIKSQPWERDGDWWKRG